VVRLTLRPLFPWGRAKVLAIGALVNIMIKNMILDVPGETRILTAEPVSSHYTDGIYQVSIFYGLSEKSSKK